MSFLARLRRLTRNLISRGFGGTGEAPPEPSIITGPCIDGAVLDAIAVGVVADAEVSGALLTAPTMAAAFGDVQISGVLADPEIEGVSIDAC